eukprot:CAMPEP_0119337952 /NCGR_PEP_ID=MMETSP1333-20130426/95088_1 /TAXON_ID=418940 /ORGANISM="Scyphosphaera apsteinii, Strain RCC1455" /LENGTH=358 /DNA_ID=CAMNT_0007349121 /DNA_START=22 /DNA_END=1099 /DNA_ORIENTATION=-
MRFLTILELHSFARGGGGLANAQRGASFIRRSMISQLDAVAAASSAAPSAESIARTARFGVERLRECESEHDHLLACEVYEEVRHTLELGASFFVTALQARAQGTSAGCNALDQEAARQLFGFLISSREMLAQQACVNAARPAHGGGHGGGCEADSIVVPAARLALLAREAVEIVKQSFEDETGDAPEMVVEGDGMCMCIPWSIQFAMIELVKNAAQASCREGNMLPILVRIAASKGTLTILVSDRGGGLEPLSIRHALEFGWTTALVAPRHDDSRQAARSRLQQAPLAGLGVGLPLARLHARRMGGGLQQGRAMDMEQMHTSPCPLMEQACPNFDFLKQRKSARCLGAVPHTCLSAE